MFERIKFNSICSDKRERKSYNYLKLKLEMQLKIWRFKTYVREKFLVFNSYLVYF